MSSGSRLIASSLTVLILAITGGCGYSAGFDEASAPGRTVAVEIAGNSTLRQRLERPLTRDLVEAVPVYSNMRLAGHRSADRILRVEIDDVEARALVRAGTTPVREGALDYRVRAKLIDARTGAVLRNAVVLDRAEFRVAVGETESTAVQEASFDLARKIVLALEEGF
jgi:hypothetical protein